jgi:alkanesulfonate monooxygenase SsuD/methylene tetrahydromethanopterin reductase-like flavin-dependent oxidoreductase (luciferase family)
MIMQFGIQLPQAGMMLSGIKDPLQAYETMTRAAQLADECGYQTIWLADHFMPTVRHPSVREEDRLFECWTALSALARDTKRVRLGQAVTCNGYRNPALLAKMADACHVFGAPAILEHKFAVLKVHCEAVGRPYESIRRTAIMLYALGEPDEQTLASITDAERGMLVRNLQWVGQSLAKDSSLVEAGTALASGGERSAFLSMGFIGSPETFRKSMAAYKAAGVQEVRLQWLDGAKPESIGRFAHAFLA